MKLEGFNVTIERGDALSLLSNLPPGSIDAIITDPPYSSGGFTRSDKAKDPSEKYTQSNQTKEWATFSGDNRDQRSWVLWMTLWLGLAQRALKPTGYILLFTDWRQLPATTDAMQAGGFVWRGLVSWNKGRGSRAPHKGYFRHQCEYVVWGSNGPCHQATHDGPYDGCYDIPNKLSDKHHLTGKPTALMRELVRCVPEGGVVLDPFMGSGTTGVACVELGRGFVGFEREAHYFEVSQKRLVDAATAKADA